jgi:hypothetical protein
MEMDAEGNARNDLQVALILQERLHRLSAGAVSGDAALWSILEIAAQEFKISAEKSPKSYKRRKRPVEPEGDGAESVECRHSCSSHMELLDPALWSSLPHEMLRLVFARLPLRDIRGLRCLSKDWDAMVTTDADFHRICDAAHGSSFALVDTDSHRRGAFVIRVFNVKSNRWDNFKMAIKRPVLARSRTENPPEMNTSVICGDGGLLCFVSSVYFKSKLKRRRPSLFITVVNPLAGISHELPPLLGFCKIRMVQIITSSEAKGFKVVVLGDYTAADAPGERRRTAEVYDSGEGSWGRGEGSLDFVFGTRCCLAGDYASSEVFTQNESCAYDFAEGRLLSLGGIGSPLEEVNYGITYAQYKDRFFRLRKSPHGPANESLATQSPTFYIEEFCVQMPARTWVKVCNHRCDPFEHPYKCRALMLTLYACRGFLMVLVQNDRAFQESMRYDIKLGWLYDLSSRKWRDLELPLLPLGQRIYNDNHTEYTVKSREGALTTFYHDSTCFVDLMCDLKWSA